MRRLGWILLGYVGCHLASALVATIFLRQNALGAPVGEYLRTFRSAFLFSHNFSATIFLLCVLIAEVTAIRSIIYYLLFCTVPTAILLATFGFGPIHADVLTGRVATTFLLAGLAGASAYWWIAGRYAGQRAASPGTAPGIARKA